MTMTHPGFLIAGVLCLLLQAGCEPAANTTNTSSAPEKTEATESGAASDDTTAAQGGAMEATGRVAEAPAPKPLPAEPMPTPGGKPSAPIRIDYKILGSAIVGAPVSVQLDITSSITDRPIAVSYAINDTASMMFPESQPRRVEARIDKGERSARRQVTVIPQREGRLYLNILAEVETDAGMMIKSMAVPIAVGAGARDTPPNGELKKDENGDDVISMPADEH